MQRDTDIGLRRRDRVVRVEREVHGAKDQIQDSVLSSCSDAHDVFLSMVKPLACLRRDHLV